VLQLPVTIEGRYRLEAVIASGGFATVYKAEQLSVRRLVAVKLLSPPPNREVWIRRAEREAMVLARLKHPNTVTVFDYGTWDDLLYLVMELVDGVTLHRYVRDQGAMPWSSVVRLGQDLLGSLAEAHSLGILHRDLKPANVMVSSDTRGRLHGRVLDFGIASLVPSEASAGEPVITQEGMALTQDGFIGTPRYAAPEQLTGQPLTPAADLYAVGLLLWEALVGFAAVPSTRIEACLQSHLGAQPWVLPTVDAPSALVELIERALHKDSSQRWQSADDMLAALEELSSASGVDASARSGELPRVNTIIDPNLDPDGEVPELLFQDVPAPRPSEQLASAEHKRRDASAAPMTELPVTAFADSPVPRRPMIMRPPPALRVAPPSHMTRNLAIGVVALALIAAMLVFDAKRRDKRAQEERARIAADTPALLRLPPVQEPKAAPLISIDGIIASLEMAGWKLELREDPTRLGNLEVLDVHLSRGDAEVKLMIASSASRDQLDDYLRSTKKDPAVYCGIYGVRVVGKNSAGRQAQGEVVGRLELWRAMVERESANKP
jgi:eukaryotic-like serine/threonine-protein kinase